MNKVDFILEKRAYKLINSIQNYQWGETGDKAYIPNLLGIEAEKNIPYAELWVGAHPALPSEVEIGIEKVSLIELCKEFPKEILGEVVAQKFGGKFPFLYKVLSAKEALSIQVHPSKQQAEELHRHDSQNYPDNNHKPEIAIALDELTALVGIKSYEKINQVFLEYPEIKEFCSGMIANSVEIFKEIIKKSVESPNELASLNINLYHRIKLKSNKTEIESLFVELFEKYGKTDVGLLCLFLLNYVKLAKGQGVFLKPGIPHAYLKGNIVECMASSDNVIRVGLTPKYKDSESLIKYLAEESGEVAVIENCGNELFKYQIKASDFQVEEFEIWKLGKNAEIKTDGKVQVISCISGELEIGSNTGTAKVKRGEVFLIPAFLEEYKLHSNETFEAFIATVPS